MPLPDEAREGSVYEEVRGAPFTPYSPAPGSEAPKPDQLAQEPSQEAQAEAPEAEAPEAEEPDPLPEFDERHRDAFQGLIYLGRLSHSFELWGHTFVAHTLTSEEHIHVALYMKQYEGTRSTNAVYQSAIVATAVDSVDGQSLPEPLGFTQNKTDVATPWVMKNWMPAVREKIWEEVFALEEVARHVLEEMGNASG